MKAKLKNGVLCLVLIAFWLLPLLFGDRSTDAEYFKTAGAYLLYLAAALVCRFFPNLHAALIAALLMGGAVCVLSHSAIYNIVPVLLLCCWLRCYLEQENGETGTGKLELFTDMIYAVSVAVAVRLIRFGYSFTTFNATDIQAVPDLCLMALVLVLFVVLFLFGFGNKARRISAGKRSRKKTRRADHGMVGVIPVYISFRTFWGFCALLLVLFLLQVTNSRLVEEAFLVARSGFRLLFFPWTVLLFLVLDVFLPKTVLWGQLHSG